MQPEITVDLTPKGDFADHFDQQAQNDSDCIKMQDKMIEHKEADDKNSKAEGNSICHAAKLGQVAPRCNYCNRPIVLATSAIRAEKPHSLSYHAKTRTVRPPTTLV